MSKHEQTVLQPAGGRQGMDLREWRLAAGLTQKELARAARVSRSSISHVENGLYPPSAPFAASICKALSSELGQRINTWDLFPEIFRRPPLNLPELPPS